MTQTQANLKALTKLHPKPVDNKFDEPMQRLKRMHDFYEDKAPDAPEKQAYMFKRFVYALDLAMKTIEAYTELTEKLAELSAEDANI